MNFSDVKIFNLGFYKHLFRFLEIDSSITWSLINSFWALLRGTISLYFILRYLSIEQQGIWYTFGSLAFLTTFADLGFTQIITQFVSHEYSKVAYKNGILEGQPYDIDRFFSLVRFSLKIYFYITPVAVIILTITGYWFFHDYLLIVLIAWFIYSFTGGLSLIGSLIQSIFQGLDKVKEIQQNIFVGSFLTTAFNWTLLICGFNIWALVCGNMFGLIIMLFVLYKKAPLFWKQAFHYKVLNRFSWGKEIIPLQWKYAISSASGYFIFNLFVPAAYKIQGTTVAGQLGITLTLIAVISGIADSWVRTKVPKFNILVANNKHEELKSLFFKSTIRSFIVFILGAVCLIICLLIFSYVDFYPNRFLDIKLTVLLLLSNIPYKVISYLAVYLRSHKIEPYYTLSAVLAAVIAFSVFVIYPHFGLLYLILSLNMVYWFIILPWAIFIYRSFNKSQRLISRIHNG